MSDDRWSEPVEYMPRPRRPHRDAKPRNPPAAELVPPEEIERFAREQFDQSVTPKSKV